MPDAALALLQAHGYAVRFRTHEWVECLVTRDEEAWVGRGPDRAAALETAVALACPSALAQALFRRAVAEQSTEAPAARPSSAPRPLPRSASRSHPPLVGRSPPPSPDVERSIEELAVLMERIRTHREEMGLCTPERQRLAILAWICEARAHTEPFPAEPRIRDAVASISRLLTEIGKAYWPGSVTALQLHMVPSDLPRNQLGGSVKTWARAAELAEASLGTVVLRDDARGHDAYGWADESALWPPVRDPTERFRKLVDEIETFGGRLAKQPSKGSPKPDPDRYLRWARELRWLRGAGLDPNEWGRVAGRLRWWGGRRDGPLVEGLRALDPSHCPPASWSEVLGARHEADIGQAHDSQGELPAALVERVRSRTNGKRLVWVGPRRDPGLLRVLGEALAGAHLDWRMSESSRLIALGTDIEHGRYDLVLGAIGLQAKQSDLMLARACKKEGVNYVRVLRGETSSCLRGLDRVLG